MAAGCHRSHSEISEQSGGPAWFADITGEAGLHFLHDAGPTGSYFLPQVMGSGAALFDYDGDGRLDIYLVHNAGPGSQAKNQLFHQEPDGRFRDVSAGSGLDVSGYGMGVAIGDVNNDGWPDVLLTEYGGVHLFLNNGNGTFREVTREAGLDCPHWATSATFFDYDRDGWLDLVVVCYVDYDLSRVCYGRGDRRDYCHPNLFGGTVTRLYRNRGPGVGGQGSERGGPVRFEEVTLKAGLARFPGPGLGVVCADFTGDHWPDIFVANDAQPNRLWVNQRDGTFREEAVERGIAYNSMGRAQANMGIALGDVDGTGMLDVFVTHLTEETHTLWKQEPRGFFHDRTGAAGLAHPGWRGTGFGTVLADFDHDGHLDLAIVNGRVSEASRPADGVGNPFWARYAERNQLFAGTQGRGFADMSASNQAFCGTAGVYRGLALGDIDGDGALDLLVTQVAGPARLFRNVAPRRGHWIIMRAFDPALRRDAYGAEISVRAGQKVWVSGIYPGQSYLCSNDSRAHFGLGPVEHVDSFRVVWPDGSEEEFPGQPADRVIELRKGSGRK